MLDINAFLRDLIANINYKLYDAALAIYNWIKSIGLIK